MKTRSAKNKGKRLQNSVRDILLETFTQLEEDDIKSTTMGESGEDIQLSPAARKLIPYAIECKNQESLNVWKSYDQAQNNCKGYEPLLVIKRNRSKVLVVLDAEYFVHIDFAKIEPRQVKWSQ